MIAVVDYGMGNLRSVQKAIERAGGDARIVSTPDELLSADKIVLPGVAAFADAMDHLRGRGLDEAIRRAVADGRPYLGFCLGLQLLFDVSYEYGEHRGLGILAGKVVRFAFDRGPADRRLRVPHIGWNQVWKARPGPMLDGVDDGQFFYFDHSYHVVPDDPDVVAATTDYGIDFVSAVARERIFATQFHPEKSQTAGLQILRNFVNWLV